MNDKIQKEVKGITPFRKICMTIGELPSSYLETMTYYEMLVWFTEFLKNTVIPTVNNNAEAVEELQRLFVKLQNYVNNYFDNLDVQDEINNKLDEMAESGVLESLIVNYLQTLSITYEQFGAVGDGETDDYSAIKQAHEYANEHGATIKAQYNKTYYVKDFSEPILIKTNVDWNNCSFIIDDTDNPVDTPLFKVASIYQPVIVTNYLNSLSKNQKVTNLSGYGNSLLYIENSNVKNYIRTGGNADSGSNLCDIVRLDDSGNVLDTILWDFETITKAILYPIDENNITIKNGNFETMVNTIDSYTYYDRNINISRSNVIVDNIKHTIVGEDNTTTSSPYDGFIKITYASNVLVKNCILQSHKEYYTSENVVKGSYDILLNNAIDIRFDNITQNNMVVPGGYSKIFASNYCKNITMKNSTITGFDCHKSMYNVTLINNIFGKDISLTGYGKCYIEKCKVYQQTRFLRFREDFGATWNGDVIIKDCELINTTNNNAYRYIITAQNAEDHNYGYKCYIPNIYIDGFKLYTGNNSTLNGIIQLNEGNPDVDYSLDYEANVLLGNYPHILKGKIELKDIEIIGGTHPKFIMSGGKNFGLLYTENVGNSINKAVNNIKKNNNYNTFIKVDNCQFTNNYYAKEYSSISINALFHNTRLNPSTFILENTHQPVMMIEIKNQDNLTIGQPCYMADYYIDNCEVYRLRDFDSNYSNYIFTNFYVENSNIHYYYYNTNPSATTKCYSSSQKCYEINNCKFINDFDNTNIANYEFPWKSFTVENNICYNLNTVKNCDYINFSDEDFTNYAPYTSLNGYAGLGINNIKNFDNIIAPYIIGGTDRRPSSNSVITLSRGRTFYNITTEKYELFDGNNWIELN